MDKNTEEIIKKDLVWHLRHTDCMKSFCNIVADEIERLRGEVEAHKTIFILKADGDGTTRSSDRPFGVAVTSEEEAKKFVKVGGVGFTHSYEMVEIFETSEEAVGSAFPHKDDFKYNT